MSKEHTHAHGYIDQGGETSNRGIFGGRKHLLFSCRETRAPGTDVRLTDEESWQGREIGYGL